MTAPIWLAGIMLAYCLWVIIFNVRNNFYEPIYGSLSTIGVYLAMQICKWYPPVLCVLVAIAAVATFIFHYTDVERRKL